MKNNRILTLLALLLLFSCPTESPMWERTFQIKNNSGYDITIRAFDDFQGLGSFEDVLLFDGDLYIGDVTSGSNFDEIEDPNNTRPASSLNASRFTLVFNGERKKTHSLDVNGNNSIVFSLPINRNLLRGGNYTDIGNDFFEFVLTEEDYNNAEPCDGDCLD
jgi:hypothetical protein